MNKGPILAAAIAAAASTTACVPTALVPDAADAGRCVNDPVKCATNVGDGLSDKATRFWDAATGKEEKPVEQKQEPAAAPAAPAPALKP